MGSGREQWPCGEYKRNHAKGDPAGNPRLYRRVSFPNSMGTDALLVRRAIDGDERALRSLWSQYAPRVDAVVRRLVGDPDYAADVAQEVWIQIFRALPAFAGTRSSGRGPIGSRSIARSTRSAAPNACKRSKPESKSRPPPHRPRMNAHSSGRRSTPRPPGSPLARGRYSSCTTSKGIRMKKSPKRWASPRADRNRNCSKRARNCAGSSHTWSSPTTTRDAVRRAAIRVHTGVPPRSTASKRPVAPPLGVPARRAPGLGGGIHARVVF